jgi:hypothetical protein
MTVLQEHANQSKVAPASASGRSHAPAKVRPFRSPEKAKPSIASAKSKKGTSTATKAQRPSERNVETGKQTSTTQAAAPQAGLNYHVNSPDYATIPPPVELLQLRGVYS